jgi:predicted nucleotidyltransferase
VRVFRLNQELVLSRLRSAAQRLVRERAEVVQVWLFGSLARREARPGSDADLLIIVRDGAGPFLERAHPLAPYFNGAGVGRDLLVYTESEARQLSSDPSSLVSTAGQEGLLLAAR